MPDERPPAPQTAAIYPEGAATSLGARVAAIVAQPDVVRAHWGIAVMALDGAPVFGLHEGQFFRPASNAKLYTATAATAMLGLDRKFTTTVIGSGEIKRGVLHGNLILEGGGDANFAGGYALPYVVHKPGDPPRQGPGLTDFADLAEQIAATGLHEVDGDVLGDDTRFENAPYPAGWAIEDMLWGYGAPASALTVHDNQLDLRITPAPAGSTTPPAPGLTPAVPLYTLNATPRDGHKLQVSTQDVGRNQIDEERQPFTTDFHVSGFVAAKYGPYTDELAIDRPAEFAAAALKQALEQRGVVVRGRVHAVHFNSQFSSPDYRGAHETPQMVQMGAVTGHLDSMFSTRADSTCQAQAVYDPHASPTRLLATKDSVPFAEDLKLTLKVSQNLHAEIMLRNLGVNRDCMNGSYLHTALAWERAFLTREAGVDGADFELFDGSGLSSKDLVTPRATAQLLLYASRQPWFATFKDALPQGGEDGTLRSRFPGDAFKGRIFAKTGTLGESRALSGYLMAASGKTVIFSVMCDAHLPNDQGADSKAMDAIVAAIEETQ